ncbi:MAG: U32 family peptidase [Candidatus Aenigmarchaeota archaeon]|nr:U32 family peptidase [Candidatus Aenigmarchaeota archaeon]
MKTVTRPEIVSPAGDWTMLRAVVNAGADAVYFGLKELNMRATAQNFSLSELEKVVKYCHENSCGSNYSALQNSHYNKNPDGFYNDENSQQAGYGINSQIHSGVGHDTKTHLTLNSIVFGNELKIVDAILRAAKKARIDMIICWDMGVVRKALALGLDVCLSTQASVSNSESAKFYKELGVRRIVPARECSLEQIKAIKKTGIEIETFVHGAMCVSISGRCFLSHHLYGKSANRGECLQPCRYEYDIIDRHRGKELVIGKNYVLSPKDLCSMPFIDKLIKAGIDAFKIEGRKRSPEYAAVTTGCYKKAVDLHQHGKLTTNTKKELIEKLGTVFNRGFSKGFYFTEPGKSDYANIGGSAATMRKEYVGAVAGFGADNTAIKIKSGIVKKGDQLIIEGPDTGIVMHKVTRMVVGNKVSDKAGKQDMIYLKIKKPVKRGDGVYLLRKFI